MKSNHSTLWIPLLAMVAACAQHNSPNESEVGGTAPLDGVWYLASDPPQIMPGIRIELTVDSANGSLFGHLSHFFSGNVGIDTKMFAPFTDSLKRGGDMTFDIRRTTDDSPGIAFRGRVTGDTIALSVFTLGADTMSRNGRRWFLIKRR